MLTYRDVIDIKDICAKHFSIELLNSLSSILNKVSNPPILFNTNISFKTQFSASILGIPLSVSSLKLTSCTAFSVRLIS